MKTRTTLKITATLFTVLLISLSSFSQSGLLKYEQNGKWGLINTKGEVIVEAAYANASGNPYYGMVWQIDPNNPHQALMGIVDQAGNWIVEVGPNKTRRVGYVTPETVNFQLVRVKDKEGLLDSTGKFIIPPKYDQIDFYGLNNLSAFNENGKWGVVDFWGKVVIPPSFPDKFSAQRASLTAHSGYKFASFTKTQQTSEGLVGVYSGDLSLKNQGNENKWGFADEEGKVVIDQKYTRVEPFSKGLSLVEINKKYGYINKEGEAVIPIEYKLLSRITEGVIYGQKTNQGDKSQTVVFDLEGNILYTRTGEVQPLTAGYMVSEQTELVSLSTDGKGYFYVSEGMGIIRLKDGEEILPPVYNYVRDVGEGCTKFAAQCECQEDSFNEKLCTVEEMGYTPEATNCKFGLVGPDGKIIFEPEFDNIGNVRNGKAYAKKGSDLYLLTVEGEKINTGLQLPNNIKTATDFHTSIAGSHPGSPLVIDRCIVWEGKKVSPALFPESSRLQYNPRLDNIRGDIYQLMIEKGNWGYIRMPSRELVYWCGEMPKAVADWVK